MMRRQAAVQGRGLALLPEALVQRDEASGALVRVLDGVLGAEGRLRVLYADRQFLAPEDPHLCRPPVRLGRDPRLVER